MMARPLVVSLAFGLALLLGAARSSAQGAEAEAKTFFQAGLQAYTAGQFLTAGHAFLGARKRVKLPELTFSVAQAFRRQFQVDHKSRHLQIAIAHYERYLKEVRTGGRRLEAVRELSELRPYLAELGIEEPQLSTDDVEVATSLLVSSSTPGAVVILDGGSPAAVPLSRPVKPGRHQVVVMASGYFSETQEVSVEQGRLLPLRVPLRPKPALLDVVGADGAEVTVDGRRAGTVPLQRPIELAAGDHFVTVTDRGHKPYGREIGFDSGASTTLTVALPDTSQRVASYWVLGSAAGAFASAAVLAGLAYGKDGDAMSIRDAQEGGTITLQQRDEHNEALASRDDFVVAAAITAGAGAALTVTGLFVYLLDDPTVLPPPGWSEDSERPDRREPREPGIEVLGSPVLGPGLLGVGLTARF